MASSEAPHPGVGGQPLPAKIQQSFSDLFMSPTAPAFSVQATASTHRGEPALIFSQEVIHKLSDPFRYALVGKFARGRPSLELGQPMKLFKWTRSFHVDRDPSVVPVRVSLPKLPIHLFNQECLFQIVATFGVPLYVDAATAALSRPSMARVCVEVDLLKPLVSRVWIGNGGQEGFWQNLDIEHLPAYCSGCFRQGHSKDDCVMLHPELTAQARPTGEAQPQGRRKGRPPAAAVAGEKVAATGELVAPALVGEKHRVSGVVLGPDAVPGLGSSAQAAEPVEAASPTAGDGRGVSALLGMQDGVEEAAVPLSLLPTAGQQEPGAVVEQLVDDAIASAAEAIFDDLADKVAAEAVDDETASSVHMQQEQVAILELNLSPRKAAPPLAAMEALKRRRGDLKQRQPGVVAAPPGVCEPKMDASRFDWIRQRLGFDGCCPTNDGRLVVFHSSEFSCSIVGQSSQYLALRVTHSQMSIEVVGVFVHAACSVSDRRELWAGLCALQVLGLPLLFHGDFNVILYAEEKRGGRPFRRAESEDFHAFIQDLDLTDVGFSGNLFTWCNNRQGRARVWKRLDRVLVDCGWLGSGVVPLVHHLACTASDHSSLLVSYLISSSSSPRSFRFQDVWLRHASFKGVVQEAWLSGSTGRPMRRFLYKLKAVKAALTVWNKNVFGNVFDALKQAEEEVAQLEAEAAARPSPEVDLRLVQASSVLKEALLRQAIFWRQKSRLRWLKEGDANSKFFHSYVRQRRVKVRIHRLQTSSGAWTDDVGSIHAMAETFFSDLFTQGPLDQVTGDKLSRIPTILSEDDNLDLERLPTAEEVRGAVFSLDRDSCSGPDGFPGSFYQACWDIIGGDLSDAVADFFVGADLPCGISATLLALIPKQSAPKTFADFRPISLWKGHSDNILLAQEMISRIGRKVRGSNVVLKLDMAKAYDRVSWMFLLSVMRKFGFGEVWLDMVWRLVSSCHFSVLINGGPVGFFRSTRGLRQGDPLSPALFIIMAEFLSLSLCSGFIPYSVPSGGSPPVHLGYADDVIVFCNGGWVSVRKVMGVLIDYQRVSGQLVNVSKSCCLLSKKVFGLRSRRVAEETGFARKSLPITYLGCPLYEGRRSKSLFAGIIYKVQARLLSWQNRWLSMGPRLILIRHVLTSIPVHLLAVLEPTRGAIWEIERMFVLFFWGDNHFHWCGWSKDSLWARFLSSLYLRGGHPNQVVVGPSRSAICRRLFQVCEQMELQIRWDVCLGDCYFWWDNWSGLGPLGWQFLDLSSDQKVSDFCVQGSWDWVRLSSFLPTEILEVMGETFMCFGDLPDQPCWQLASSGFFSTASAYPLVRRAGVKSLVFRSLWDSSIPLKVSCFAWRLFSSRLPLDDVLRTRCRFAGPSQCPLCLAAQETADHLFSSCLVAQAVWSFFECRLGIPMAYCGYRTRCMTWWSQPVSTMSIRWLYRILSLIILWFLWKASNKWRFDGIKWSVQTLCYSISHELWLICSVKFPGGSLPPEFGGLVSVIWGIQRPLSSTLVSWEFPQNGFVKLNTDGSSSSTAGASGIGGIL
nr:uncharacterized protein LOC113724399 [Coffea arabica]